MTLSLAKKQELVKVVLAKRNVPESIVMQVKTCIDISGSMMELFENGTVQELVDRLLAVAVRFDDNQSIESYAFGSGAVKLSDITPSMFGGYVNNKFIPEAGKTPYLWSGTDYSSALKLVNNDLAPGGTPAKKGFFGFGKKEATPAPAALPTYLLFVTDGETAHEHATEALLGELAAKKVYVQFIGLGHGSYRFIERMGDKYDHVGFVSIKDIERTSDEQLYETLLTDELATWIKGQ